MSILLKFSDYDNLTDKRIIYLESKKSKVSKYHNTFFMFHEHTEDEKHRYLKLKEIDRTTGQEINDFIFLSRRELKLNYTLRVLI